MPEKRTSPLKRLYIPGGSRRETIYPRGSRRETIYPRGSSALRPPGNYQLITYRVFLNCWGPFIPPASVLPCFTLSPRGCWCRWSYQQPRTPHLGGEGLAGSFLVDLPLEDLFWFGREVEDDVLDYGLGFGLDLGTYLG